MAQSSNIKRPDLFEGWLDNIKSAWNKYGVVSILPWWIIIFALIGVLATWRVSKEFFNRADLSVPFYVGILTVDGLFLAFSWSSFIKIYEAAGAPEFSSYLRRNGLLTKYFFHVDYIHVTQIIAVFCSAASLITAVTRGVPRWGEHVAFAASISTLLYALRYALGAVRIMQDIVWYRAIFDGAMNEHRGGVVRLQDGGR